MHPNTTRQAQPQSAPATSTPSTMAVDGPSRCKPFSTHFQHQQLQARVQLPHPYQHSSSGHVLVPQPRSSTGGVSATTTTTNRAAAGTLTPQTTTTPSSVTRTHNPYLALQAPPVKNAMPHEFYDALCQQLPREWGCQGEGSELNRSFVTFHTWESIRTNAEVEAKGMPSPLQPMSALVELHRQRLCANKMKGEDTEENSEEDTTAAARQSSIEYGCHMGQFLNAQEHEEQNFLTLRLLADLSGVVLYKCDFDPNSCCRVFLDGPQSYLRLTALTKRLRCTLHGVFVAHDEKAAYHLEKSYFGGGGGGGLTLPASQRNGGQGDALRRRSLPSHSIPIERMLTSHETGARRHGAMWTHRMDYQQQQQTFGTVSSAAQPVPCRYMAVPSPTWSGGLVYSTPPAGTITYDIPAVNYVLAPKPPVMAPLTAMPANSSMSSASSFRSVKSDPSGRRPSRTATTDFFETFVPRPAGGNGGATPQTKKNGAQKGSVAVAKNGGTAGVGDQPQQEGSEEHLVNFQTICRHHLEGKCNRRYCRFRHVPVNSPEAQAILQQQQQGTVPRPNPLPPAGPRAQPPQYLTQSRNQAEPRMFPCPCFC